MAYFTTEQRVLFYSYALEAKQTSKLDQFLALLEDSGIAEIVRNETKVLVRGSPPHDPARMFATILYGFAGLAQVEVEIMLTGLGFNLRKFFRYSEKGWNARVWHAPEGTQPESFKKPSAKRLENRVKKKRVKSANEQAKDSHKYKKF